MHNKNQNKASKQNSRNAKQHTIIEEKKRGLTLPPSTHSELEARLRQKLGIKNPDISEEKKQEKESNNENTIEVIFVKRVKNEGSSGNIPVIPE